jgi:hypothetical protein
MSSLNHGDVFRLGEKKGEEKRKPSLLPPSLPPFSPPLPSSPLLFPSPQPLFYPVYPFSVCLLYQLTYEMSRTLSPRQTPSAASTSIFPRTLTLFPPKCSWAAAWTNSRPGRASWTAPVRGYFLIYCCYFLYTCIWSRDANKKRKVKKKRKERKEGRLPVGRTNSPRERAVGRRRYVIYICVMLYNE